MIPIRKPRVAPGEILEGITIEIPRGIYGVVPEEIPERVPG